MTDYPTDEQIDELWDEVGQYFALYDSVTDTVREALRRWGTPEPVALKDREPQPSNLDERGCCWWWDSFDEQWEFGCASIDNEDENLKQFPETWTTHWLPYWAIKEPGPDEALLAFALQKVV